MFLYHGTSSKHLDFILKNGIQPTSTTGVISHWDIASASDRVYLTDTYATHYAIASAMELDYDDEGIEKEEQIDYDAVIFKVKVDEADFIPDEDFLAQFLRKPSGDIEKDTKFYRDTLDVIYEPSKIQELGLLSLEHLGTVCVPSIKPEDIIEYTVLPNKKLVEIIMTESDPTVSITHHKLIGCSYKEDLKSLRDRYETFEVTKQDD